QLAGASKLLVAFFEFSVKLCQLGGSFLNPKLQDVIEMPHLFLGVPAHTFVFHVLQSKRKIVSDLFEQSHNVILKHVGICRVNAEHACELAELLKSKKTGGANSLPQSHVTIVEHARIGRNIIANEAWFVGAVRKWQPRPGKTKRSVVRCCNALEFIRL